jgi:hypothetical protein
LYNRRRLNSCIAYPASAELVKASSPQHEVRPFSDEEDAALARLLSDTINDDRYPF